MWLGKTPDCDTDCKTELAGDIAKGEGVVSAHMAATAGLGVLPGGMQISAGIGGAADAGMQYVFNGKINPTDVLISTYTGALTAGTKFLGTVGWNATGSSLSSYLKGEDPLTGAMTGAAGAAAGYLGGTYLLEKPLTKFINPNWKSYEWIDIGMGISKPLPLSPAPGILGNIGGSVTTEVVNKSLGSKEQGK